MRRLFLLLVLVTLPAFGQGVYRGNTQTTTGQAVAGVTITVCTYNSANYTTAGVYNGPLPCTTPVSIYSDPGLANLITPPLLSDGQGNFSFAATNGNYTITITAPGRINPPLGYIISLGGGGGGVTPPASPNLSLQYNNSGAFGGSNFYYGSSGGLSQLGSILGTSSTYCNECAFDVIGSGSSASALLGIVANHSYLELTPSLADGDIFICEPDTPDPSVGLGTCTFFQGSSGADMLAGIRYSDMAPSGNFLVLYNAEDITPPKTKLFYVDTTGSEFVQDLTINGTCTGCPGAVFQVNGTPVVDQSLVNFAAGSNMTITDNGSGTLTFAASGSGGGTTPGGSNGNFQYNASSAFGGVPDLNFDGTHTLTLGSSGILTLTSGATLNGLTNAMLPTSAVTPTSYTNASITVNSKGIVTSASNGTAPVTSFTGDGNLLSNSGSTGAVTATLATAGAHQYWGNNTGSTAAPGYVAIVAGDLPSLSTTVNSQTCAIGGNCTIPFLHNAVSNSSQAGLDVVNSAVNAVGLAATFSNPTTNAVTVEITGGAYTGTASNLSGTPTVPNGTAAATQSCSDTSTKLATDNFVKTCLPTNPMTTLGDETYGGASGVFTRLTGPTTPNGVPQTLIDVPSGSLATAEVFALPGVTTRVVGGTTSTDTIVSTDCNPARVDYQGSVAVAVTLPTATTLAVPNCVFRLTNNTSGSSTAVTVTPTTWTVNGGSSLAIAQGRTCTWYVDPAGSAWDADCSDLPITAGAGVAIARGQYGPTLTAKAVVQNCGTTVTCANTIVTAPIFVFGTAPLSSGAPSTATITSLPYTSVSSYVCTATEASSATGNLLKVVNSSGATTVITGPATVTDTVGYQCIGS